MTEGTINNKYVTGDSEFIVEITTAAAMTSDQVTTLPFQFPFRVIDFYGIATAAGGAGDTATLKAVATDGTTERTISDAMDMNKSDNVVTRVATIIDSAYQILAGECLRIETASDTVAKFIVRGIKG